MSDHETQKTKDVVRPLLQFETGLIATSVALFAIAVDTLDKQGFGDLARDLAAWMAVTLVVATLAVLVLQVGRSLAAEKLIDRTGAWAYRAVAAIPVIPGTLGAIGVLVDLQPNLAFWYC